MPVSLARCTAQTKGGVNYDLDLYDADQAIPVQIVTGRHYAQGLINRALHVAYVRAAGLTNIAQASRDLKAPRDRCGSEVVAVSRLGRLNRARADGY
jgi:hypothetical protein